MASAIQPAANGRTSLLQLVTDSVAGRFSVQDLRNSWVTDPDFPLCDEFTLSTSSCRIELGVHARPRAL